MRLKKRVPAMCNVAKRSRSSFRGQLLFRYLRCGLSVVRLNVVGELRDLYRMMNERMQVRYDDLNLPGSFPAPSTPRFSNMSISRRSRSAARISGSISASNASSSSEDMEE